MKGLVATVVVVCLAVNLQFELVSGQMNVYGSPPYCLFNRLEYVNCTFRFPKRTPVPRDNQYGAYKTILITSPGGQVPDCFIRRNNYVVENIPTLGGDERVMFIFNPGLRLPEPVQYRNKQIIMYNVKCPAGHLAFFNITNIQMEERNCFNPGTNQMMCVDYVQITRPGFGTTESCGSSPGEDNANQFERGELQILFKTSDSKRAGGYEISVICFRRDDGDREGCTRPGNSTDNGMATGNSRRKRDLDEFHNEWRSHLSRMKRQNIQPININIPHGVTVRFDGRQLTFTVEDGGREFIPPIKNIFVLNTFDGNGTRDEFKDTASVGDQVIPLPGPGPLAVVGNYAYFQLFVIDPRGLVPNPEEMAAINDLTQAQRDLVVDEELPTDMYDPGCVDYAKFGLPVPDPGSDSIQCVNKRRRRQTPEPDFSDEDILMAIENENACNPVLLTTAQSTLKYVESVDSDRLARLRSSSAGTR